MRRITAFFGGIACALAFAAAGAAQAGSAGSAVTYQLNPAHTGSVDFKKNFAPPLAQVWSVDLGGGNLSGPILIAHQTVFVTANGLIVTALDLATGAQKWSYTFACCGSLGAYDRGRLFYVNSQGVMTALSAASGTKLWSTQLTGQSDFTSPPMAADGKVYTVGAGSNATLYAVDEKSGAIAWTQEVFGGSGASPTLGDGGVFVAFPCNYYKFAPEDGTQIWFYHGGCSGGAAYTPAYFQNRVYIADDDEGGPYVLNAHDGSIVGTFPPRSDPTVYSDKHSGKTRGVTIGYDGTLTCWNAKTGESVWTFTKDPNLQGTALAIGGTVFVRSQFGTVYGLDARNGNLVWTGNLGAVGGLAAGENALVATGGTTVAAYRPQ